MTRYEGEPAGNNVRKNKGMGEGSAGKRGGTKMRKVNDVKSARDSLFAEYLHS